MRKPLHNQKGTTLVELVVCMVLMALFSVAAVALVHPAAQTFIETQRLTRAQNLADALVETLRGELEQADGEISFANGEAEGGGVFADMAASYQDGSANALQLGLSSGYIEVLDWAEIENLKKITNLKTDEAEEVDDADAKAAGYLHMRYIMNNTSSVTAAKSGTVYAYTTAYPKSGYMGLKILSLKFYARGWEYQTKTETTKNEDGTETKTTVKDETKPVRLTSLTVKITIGTEDSDGTQNVLTTEQAIIPLPRKPIYSKTPLTNADPDTSSGT